MTLPQHPSWIPPLPPVNEARPSVPSRARINSTSRTVREQTINVLAADEVIPIIYGERIAGAKIFTLYEKNNSYYLGCAWSLGENDSIIEYYADNKPALDVNGFTVVSEYLGLVTQQPDPTLSADISNYNDSLVASVNGVLIGICYSVLSWPVSVGSINITAKIRGRKVYDPRVPVTAWSDNPSLCLADFLINVPFGAGGSVDWAQISVAADANDELVLSEKRRLLNIIISSRASTDSWIEALRAHSAVFINKEGSEYRVVPNRPGAVSQSFTEANIRKNTLILEQRGFSDVPTVISSRYIETKDNTERNETAVFYADGVLVGQENWRESNVNFDGITRFSQAFREATERYNTFALVDLVGSFETFDTGLTIEIGDIIELTHPIGLDQKQLRITQVSAIGYGRYQCQFEEYTPGIYSDSVQQPIIGGDTNLPNPFDLPDVTNLLAVEELFQRQTGVWSTRLKITYDQSIYPFLFVYAVQVFDSLQQIVFQIDTTSLVVYTGTLQEQELYTVNVSIKNAQLGVSGNPALFQVQALGKFFPPSDVQQITAVRVDAGTVRLSWLVTPDASRYEIRIGQETDTWDSVGPSSIVDTTDRLTMSVSVPSLGLFKFMIKAIDSVGVYSVNETSVLVSVSVPGDVTNFNGVELGGSARLSWSEANGFVSTYKVKYGLLTASWETALDIDSVRALRLISDDAPPGEWRYFVKAVDSLGNESTNAAFIDLVISTDSTAFSANVFTPLDIDASSVNFDKWSHNAESNSQLYVAPENGGQMGTKFPNAMSTYGSICAEGAFTCTVFTDPIDLNRNTTGNFVIESSVSEFLGDSEQSLQVQQEGQAWNTPLINALSYRGNARYCRLKAEATSGEAFLMKLPQDVRITFTTLPRTENSLENEISNITRNCLSFDGLTEYVSIPQNFALQGGTKTFQFVFFADDVTTFSVIYEQGSENNGMSFYVKNGFLYIVAYEQFVLNPFFDSYQVTAGSFYNVICEFYGNADVVQQWNIYINGSLVSSKVFTALLSIFAEGDVNIGRRGLMQDADGNKYTGVGDYFNGKILSVRQWDVRLTTEELVSLIKDGTVPSTSLVQEYDFTLGSGTLADDTSPTNNDGTIFASWSTIEEPKIIITEQNYIAAQSININPISANPKTTAIDNVIIGIERAAFNSYIFDASTLTQNANVEFQWTFTGI